MNRRSPNINLRSSDFPIYLSGLLMDCAMASIVLITPWYAQARFGVSMEQWGRFTVAGSGSYMIGCLLLGRLSDCVGSRPLVICGATLCALNYAVVPHLPSLNWLIANMMMGGISVSCFWPPVQSWLGRGRDREHLGRTLGFFNLFWTIGLMIGPPIVEPLFRLNYKLAYYFIAACPALVVPLVLATREHRNGNYSTVAVETNAGGQCETPAGPHPLARRFLLAAWLANGASWFMLSDVRHLLQFFAPTIGVDSRTLAQVMSGTGIVQLLTFLALSRVHSWHYRLGPMLIAQGVAAVGMLVVFNASGAAMLTIGLCVTGICTGMSYTASLFYSTHGQAAAGKNTGFHEGLLAIGVMLGPPLGGWLGDHWTRGAPFLMCAVALMLAMAVELKIVSGARCQVPGRDLTPDT